jgi:HTH-type transcriptional regulator, competence development regulator
VADGQTFGAFLRALREDAGLTLREAEARCGVSNGYLSLLEHDRVKEPSPRVLYALSRCFGVGYLELMERAGYPVPTPEERGRPAPGPPGAVFRGAERLSPDDREEIRELIRLKLRRLRGRPGASAGDAERGEGEAR